MKHRIDFVLFGWLLGLAISFVPQATAAAATFNYNTNVIYRIEESGVTYVSETYTVTNNTARQYLSEMKLSTPTEQVESLKVYYADGTNIPATTEAKSAAKGDIKYNYQEIRIVFPRQNYGQGRAWSFKVEYQTKGLVESKGSAHTVYVPSIDPGDPSDTYTAKIDVPQSFGQPHFTGAQSASGGITGGRQFYNFNKQDLIAQSLALAFGDSTFYETNFNFPLANDSPLPRTFTITLPPDLNNQKIYVNKLDPAPLATRLDEDGNVLADYRLNPGQKLTVKTTVLGEVKYLEYNLSASLKKADIPKNLVEKYTKATRYWKVDGAVADEAKKITDPEAPVINNVKAIYRYTIDKLSYNNDKIKFNIRQGADKAMADPTNAVCLEYADLMIAMLRSQGIPARMPVGYSYSGSLKESKAVADSLHAWVEAYVPGIGWMTLDPTWGEKFDQFGKSDIDRFAFAVWGADDSEPVAVTNGRFDTNYQYEATTLEYKTKAAPVTHSGKVSVERWVILPFLAIDRVKVQAQPQLATDSNEVSLTGQTIQFGSLAPGQKSGVNKLVLGENWNKSGEAKYTRVNNGSGALVLAAANVNVNYWLMSVILIVVLVVGGRILMVRLRSRKPKKAEIKHPEQETNE